MISGSCHNFLNAQFWYTVSICIPVFHVWKGNTLDVATMAVPISTERDTLPLKKWNRTLNSSFSKLVSVAHIVHCGSAWNLRSGVMHFCWLCGTHVYCNLRAVLLCSNFSMTSYHIISLSSYKCKTGDRCPFNTNKSSKARSISATIWLHVHGQMPASASTIIKQKLANVLQSANLPPVMRQFHTLEPSFSQQVVVHPTQVDVPVGCGARWQGNPSLCWGPMLCPPVATSLNWRSPRWMDSRHGTMDLRTTDILSIGQASNIPRAWKFWVMSLWRSVTFIAFVCSQRSCFCSATQFLERQRVSPQEQGWIGCPARNFDTRVLEPRCSAGVAFGDWDIVMSQYGKSKNGEMNIPIKIGFFIYGMFTTGTRYWLSYSHDSWL